MVTNPDAEFLRAKEKFENAKNVDEKLNALYEMLRTAPKHKGASNLLKWITREIAKYQELKEKKEKKKGGGIKLIEKSGDILISIIGIENSGKSYFIKKFINENIEVSDIPFSTKEPVTFTKFYKGVYYQFVEIPSTFKSIYRSILSISDFFIIILDSRRDIEEQINRINIFSAGINAFSLEEEENYIIILNKYDDFKDINFEEILEKIIKKLNLIRVFPINSDHCVLLKRGSKIEDFIKKLNQKWIEKFQYAKIKRNNKIIRAGLNYILEDMDIVELKIRS